MINGAMTLSIMTHSIMTLSKSDTVMIFSIMCFIMTRIWVLLLLTGFTNVPSVVILNVVIPSVIILNVAVGNKAIHPKLRGLCRCKNTVNLFFRNFYGAVPFVQHGLLILTPFHHSTFCQMLISQ
jgi:hypothetical protein